MMKNRFFRLGSGLVLFFTLAPGCLPPVEKEVVRIPRTDVAPPSPSLPLGKVNERIRALSQLLEDPRLNAGDRETVHTLLATYRAIKELAQDPRDERRSERIADLLLARLKEMEEKTLFKAKTQEGSVPDALSLLTLLRKNIFDDYLAANDDGVVQGCLEMEEAFGPDSLTPDIGVVFAISLANKGRFEDALRIAESIDPKLEGIPDLVFLRSRMIGWFLARGDRKTALEEYERLLAKLDERDALLNAAERNLSERGGVSASRAPAPAEPSPSREPREIKGPGILEDTLAEVDRLVQSREFDKAKLLLIQQKIRSADGPQAEAIEQALQSVETAEREFAEEEERKAALRVESLKAASNLIAAEEYEEAIARLDTLSREDETDAQAGELRSLAVEKIITRERNRAAKLFLMARQTREPARRQELLRSSHEILKALVDKYPLSPLNQKIKDNMSRIEEELMKLKSDSG